MISQATPFSKKNFSFVGVAFKSYTCKNGTASSEKGHNILPENVKNERGAVCIPAGSG